MAKGILKLEDGREVVVEYNPDDYKGNNPYKRAAKGEPYYFINVYGEVTEDIEKARPIDDKRYEYHNYINDEEYCKKVARAEKLKRDLEAFSREHYGDKIDWGDDASKYYIFIDHSDSQFGVNLGCRCEIMGTVYFHSKGIAEQAIKQYHDELIWYFTESGL